MTIHQAIILGIVEGLTEFLPISSTGHMILVSKLLDIPSSPFLSSFEIIVQLGAILAVVVLYFPMLIKKISFWPTILAAFIPTSIIGFILYALVKHVLLGNALVTVIALAIGGILFIILERLFATKTSTTNTLEQMTWKQGVLIGLSQSLSIIPGVSRSAASIFGGMAGGLDRETAVLFSFILAIPTMAAATGFDLFKSTVAFSHQEITLLVIGASTAFVTALIAIRSFLSFVKHHTFIPFGIYRIIIAILFGIFFL